MKNYSIYQGIYNNEYWENQFKNEINMNRYGYKVVYKSEHDDRLKDENILERLFKRFNYQQPRNYKGRSLSVGDIVQLDNLYYVCCSIGWKEIKIVESENLDGTNTI